jgi:hypothetical protein
VSDFTKWTLKILRKTAILQVGFTEQVGVNYREKFQVTESQRYSSRKELDAVRLESLLGTCQLMAKSGTI